MQNYSFKIRLRIWHPTINPDAITNALGIKPNRSWQKGNKRTTPKGTSLSGRYRESYWNADPFNYGEYQSTDELAIDVIVSVLDILKAHKSFLKKLHKDGARIVLQVSSFSHRNYAIEIPPKIMQNLSELKISFAHDIYPYMQSS